MALSAIDQTRATRRWCSPFIAILVLAMCLPAPLYAFDFSRWDVILRKNIRPSTYAGIEYAGFDYGAILSSREFEELVGSLASFSPEELRGKDETMAFWINVYNIFAVKLVRDHFPVTGIKSVGNIISPVWSLPAGNVGGKMYSLNKIEHEILRPMKEPAIHFAIVCASISCPDLLPEAYTAANLHGQMKSQAIRFLENKGKGMRVDSEEKTVQLSRIFDWYEEDFAGVGGIAGFLDGEWSGNRKVPADYTTKYLPYNWNLNAVR